MRSVSLLFLLLIVNLLEETHCSLEYLNSWSKFEHFTQEKIINFITNAENDISIIFDRTELTSYCYRSLKNYINGIKRFSLKDIKRLDSTGKWPTGLLSGTFTDLGSYDTCISLQFTQYCLLYTNVPLMPEHGYEGFMRPYDPKLFNFSTEPFKFFQKYIHFLRQMNITTGLCVPKECSRFELTNFIGNLYQHFNTGLTANVDLCYAKPQSVPWRASELIGLIVIIIVISLNVIGMQVSEISFFYCFNFKANASKLCKIGQSDEPLRFLDGIKALTMIMVVMSHLQLGNMYNLFSNTFKFHDIAEAPILPFLIVVSPYNVDLFLMITGVLMGYLFFSKKQKFQLVPYILIRWLRFSILLAWVICLRFVFFGEHFRRFIGGPFWSDYGGAASIAFACEQTWPFILSLSQFWFESSQDVNVCQLFDWYLAADFILSLLFLIVLWPYLKKKPILALINTYILIVIGLIATGLGIYLLDIPPTWIVSNFQRMPFLRYSFDFNLKPWPHIGPYFVGVLFGYILSKPKLKLSKIELAFGWFLCILFLSTNFGYEFAVSRYGIDFDYPIAFIYGVFSKTIWAAGWAWILLILKLGYFPFISRVLSLKIFQILSRISLSVLCVHGIVIRLRSATTRVMVFPTYTEGLLFNYMPLYVIIYFLSFITALFIEFPTVNLLKRFFLPKKHAGSKRCNNELNSLESIKTDSSNCPSYQN